MPLTKSETTALADVLRALEIPSRVAMFNELIPWLRHASPRYSIVDFYEKVFYYSDEVRWNNNTGRAEYKNA